MLHRTCRMCLATTSEDCLVKYGTRHYAHFTCYLDAGKALSDLPFWQVGRFPHAILKQRGLLREAELLADGD